MNQHTVNTIACYERLPSYKIVILLKRCRQLLEHYPKLDGRIKTTIFELKRILIERQVL